MFQQTRFKTFFWIGSDWFELVRIDSNWLGYRLRNRAQFGTYSLGLILGPYILGPILGLIVLGPIWGLIFLSPNLGLFRDKIKNDVSSEKGGSRVSETHHLEWQVFIKSSKTTSDFKKCGGGGWKDCPLPTFFTALYIGTRAIEWITFVNFFVTPSRSNTVPRCKKRTYYASG